MCAFQGCAVSECQPEEIPKTWLPTTTTTNDDDDGGGGSSCGTTTGGSIGGSGSGGGSTSLDMALSAVDRGLVDEGDKFDG